MRVDGIGVFAGHGVADPNYRPPRLPYVSVVGPLNLERESDRDPPRSLFLWVQTPGYLAGAARTATDLVPGPGQLDLRLDEDATVSLALDFGALAGSPMDDDNTSQQVASIIELALRTAVDDGDFQGPTGPVTDEARLAELRAITVRWDREPNRLVISSGRRGPVPSLDADSPRPSRVEILNGAGGLGPALGLNEGALLPEGRIVRHRVPNPIGVAVDLRFDMWAGSQQDLATVMDAWARITPTRGQLLVQPALLAQDVDADATTVSLQSGGESRTRWTLAQFEPSGGFADRLSGDNLAQANGAVADAEGLRFTANATATTILFAAPAIPDPLRAEHPGPTGYAVSLGLRVDPGAANGNAFQFLALEHQGLTVLRLEVQYLIVNGELQAEVRASAEQASGVPFLGAVAQVESAALEVGVELHVIVHAGRGVVTLFLNGLRLPATSGTPAPGAPAGGHDLQLILGDAGGSPIGFRITHLQLHGRPLGPIDPMLRRTTSSSGSWSVGDPIALVRTENGFLGSGESFNAVVIAVNGDTVTLDRPVEGGWQRAETLVYKRNLFFAQRQLRRRDDLMNNLYRITMEYHVSAFLDDRYPSVSAPLVETPEVEIRELARLLAEGIAQAEELEYPEYPSRPAPGRPGVRTTVTSSHGNNTKP